MKMMSTSQFAKKHGVSASRIRQLLLEERIFPYQKLGGGQWILFTNYLKRIDGADGDTTAGCTQP